MGKPVSPAVFIANKNGMKKKDFLKLFVLFFCCLFLFIQCSSRK